MLSETEGKGSAPALANPSVLSIGSGYLADIYDVLRIKEQNGFRLAFYTLTSKGVFHDCEGKVTEVKGDEIVIETEY